MRTFQSALTLVFVLEFCIDEVSLFAVGAYRKLSNGTKYKIPVVTGKTSLYKALGISVKVKYIALHFLQTDGHL